MKLKLLTAALILGAMGANAQTIPKQSTIKLTDKDVLRLDSALNYANAIIDSKQATAWFNKAFEPIINQVRMQMDTVKKVQEKKKNNL